MSTVWWVLLNVAVLIAGIVLACRGGRVNQEDDADELHFRGGVDDGWFMP